MYRSRFIISGIAMLIGVLMGVAVVLVLNMPTSNDIAQLSPTSTMLPVQAPESTNRQSPDATLAAPISTVQSTPTPSPTAANVAVAEATPTSPPPAVSTTVPTNVPTATPTTAPPATATPTPTALSAPALLTQVAQAEEALRSGQLESVLNYGNGNRSSASARFDLGDGQQEPRLHILTTYEGAEGIQTIERITIGAVTWERQPGSAWTTVAAQVVVWDQVQTFLPHAAAGADPRIERASDANRVVLQWHDAGRDADVTLLVDPVTGTPHELRRFTRSIGLTVTVTYTGWNTPVAIDAPAGT